MVSVDVKLSTMFAIFYHDMIYERSEKSAIYKRSIIIIIIKITPYGKAQPVHEGQEPHFMP